MPEANYLPNAITYDNNSPCECISGYAVSPTEVRAGDKIEFTFSINDKAGTSCVACGIWPSVACSHATDAVWEDVGDKEGLIGTKSCLDTTYGENSPLWEFSDGWADRLYVDGEYLEPGDPEYPRSHKVTFTIDPAASKIFVDGDNCGAYARAHGSPGPFIDNAIAYWVVSCPFNILSACDTERHEKRMCKTGEGNVNGVGAALVTGAAIAGLPLTYNSSQSANSANLGMKYGWSFGGLQSELSTETVDGDDLTQLDFPDGSSDNWTDSGTGYSADHCDNHDKLVDNGDDTFTITSKNGTERNFDDNGLLSSIVDRNGNTLTINRDTAANNHRITDIDDGRGRVIYFKYFTGSSDTQPQYIWVNDDTDGRKWEFTYNINGQLASIINPENETTLFTYDGNDRLWKVTDPRSKLALTLTYHSGGYSDGKVNVETFYDQVSNTYTYSEDSEGNLTTTVVTQDLATSPTPPSRTTTYDYDKRRALVKVADPLDNEHEYMYLDINNPYLVSRYIDPNNNVTAYIYDDDANVTSIITGTDVDLTMDGDETTFVYYDGTETGYTAKKKHLVKQIKRPEIDVGGTPTRYETDFEHDADGNLTKIIDALDKETVIEYETTTGLEGEIKSITDRNGNKTEFTYYVWNASNPERYGRNGGNLKTVKTPSGPNGAPARTTTFRYNDLVNDSDNLYDNVVEVEDNDGNVWKTEWDDMDRPTKLTDARTKFTNLSYVNGLLDYIEAPANNGSSTNRRETKFHYDNPGRLIKTESDISATTKETRVEYDYDGHSNMVELVRWMGGSKKTATTYEHDKLDRLTKVTDPESRVTNISLEKFCKGMTETSARGVVRDYSLDHLCRLTELNTGTDSANPVSEKHEFQFDELGRLTKVIQTEVARYDGAGSPPPRVKARYGSSRYGDPATPDYPTEEREFEYDALDRLTKVTFPGGETIDYVYDFEGNLTKMTDTENNETQYTYYNDNRLYEVKVIRGVTTHKFTYTYDTAGRLAKIEYPEDSATSKPLVEVHFDDGATPTPNPGWNANGQLTHMRYLKDDGLGNLSLKRAFTYEYVDDSGNRTAMVEDNGVAAQEIRWEYSYDWLDRLVEVKRGVGGATPDKQRTYEYDESDNRTYMDDHIATTKTSYKYTYNDADELTKVESATANFPSRNDLDFSDLETFVYDADGNMTSRTVGSDVTSYEWDDFDRLIAVEMPDDSKVVNLYDSGGLRKERVFDDGEKVKSFFSGLPTVNESSASDTFSYLMGHQLLGFEKNGNFNYFVTDGLSSVRLVLNSSGTEVASYEHDEFGNELAKTGSGSSPKTYVGGLGVHDDTEKTDLLYMRARHYDSDLGRFLNRDPIGFGGGLNQYIYTRNNPSNFVDPTGLIDERDYLRIQNVAQRIAANPDANSVQKFCRILRLVSAEVASNKDFVQTVQGLFVANVDTVPLERGMSPFPYRGRTSGERPVAIPPDPYWRAMYRDRVRGSLNNSDQGHHFAALLTLGYKYSLAGGLFGSYYQEWSQGPLGNQGDINIGNLAANMGAALRLADREVCNKRKLRDREIDRVCSALTAPMLETPGR